MTAKKNQGAPSVRPQRALILKLALAFEQAWVGSLDATPTWEAACALASECKRYRRLARAALRKAGRTP